MTDFSTWSDKEINEFIFKKRGGRVLSASSNGAPWWHEMKKVIDSCAVPDYCHDWESCGELITEMENSFPDGWEFSCEHSSMSGELEWHVWMLRYSNGTFCRRVKHVSSKGNTFMRAIANCYSAWKEEEND